MRTHIITGVIITVVTAVLITSIALSFETPGVVNGRVWVTDPMRNAPIASSDSGENVYIVWWTNRTGNDEVMFRASTDGGKTFGEKMNLSNSPQAESQEVEIATFGNNDAKIIVSWWERNQTINEPVFRISTDNGKTFEPALNLSSNGPISTNSTAGR